MGPVVGGFLVENGGWQYAFWVNLPLGVIAFLLTLYAVPRANQRKQVPLDWQGSVLLVLGLGAFVFATINLSLYPLSSLLVWPGWLLGALVMLCFVWWEKRAPGPVMPARLVKNREFILLNAYCITVFVSFAAVMFLVPYVLISSLGLSASTAALNMLPLGVCISLMARPVGAWADRVGYRTPMIYGALGIALATMSACALVWLRTPWSGAIVTTLLGCTAGLMVTPLTTGVLNSVDTEDSGLASGINHAVSRVGNLIAIAVCGAALALRYQAHFHNNIDRVAQSDATVRQIEPLIQQAADKLGQFDLISLPEDLHIPVQQLVTTSLDRAFVEVMLAASLFALLAALSASALRRSGSV